MEIYQLRTFVAVAREGSITRAAEEIPLSQPAVSAHIKAMEETLGLILFERTSRGMRLTRAGQQLLDKAEQTLAAHKALLQEAVQIKGQLSGKIRLGACGSASADALSQLILELSTQYPNVDVTVHHSASQDILNGIRQNTLDAGFYNEAHAPAEDLTALEISRFYIYLVAPPGLVDRTAPLDWQALAELPWICPDSQACCGQAAEDLFLRYNIRPKHRISIDREPITRALIAKGTGLGFLHSDTAQDAALCGDVDVLYEMQRPTRVLFASLTNRAQEPLLKAMTAIIEGLYAPG